MEKWYVSIVIAIMKVLGRSSNGGGGGATMESTKSLVAIVVNNPYWLYLGNESNVITKFFDTGLACTYRLYTCIDNALISGSITLFYLFFCSFCVPEHESKVPEGSASANLCLIDQIYFRESYLHQDRGKLWIS